MVLAIGQTVSATPETVVVPSGNLRLKAFLWQPAGSGGADADHTGRALSYSSCRKTCPSVSETWLRISLPVPPRARAFSRPRPVHTRHLAARRRNEREGSSTAFAVRVGHHGSP